MSEPQAFVNLLPELSIRVTLQTGNSLEIPEIEQIPQ